MTFTLPATQRPPVDGAVEQLTALGIPDDAAALWGTTDGLLLGDGIEVCTAADVVKAAKLWLEDPWHPTAELAGLIPFTEANDSDPFCIATAEPIRGWVIRAYHDGTGEQVVALSLSDFLESIAQRGVEPFFDERNFHVERTPDTIDAADKLLTKWDGDSPEALSAFLPLLSEESLARLAADIDFVDDDFIDVVAKLGLTSLKPVLTKTLVDCPAGGQRDHLLQRVDGIVCP